MNKAIQSGGSFSSDSVYIPLELPPQVYESPPSPASITAAPNTSSTSLWLPFKIASLQLNGEPLAAVQLSLPPNGKKNTSPNIHAVYPEHPSQLSYLLQLLQDGRFRRSSGEKGGLSIVLIVLKQLSICNKVAERHTGSGGKHILIEEKRKSEVIIGDDVWEIGTANEDGEEDGGVLSRGNERKEAKFLINGSPVDLKGCTMCDNHLYQGKEWIELVIDVDAHGIRERLIELIERRMREVQHYGNGIEGPRFWSRFVVGTVTKESLRDIVETQNGEEAVAMRLTRRIDWLEVTRYIATGFGIVLVSFGLALFVFAGLAVRRCLSRNGRRRRRRKGILEVEPEGGFSPDFYFLNVEVVGDNQNWIMQLIREDTRRQQREVAAANYSIKDKREKKEVQNAQLNAPIKEIPRHGLVRRLEGNNVNVSFRVNCICSVCMEKKNRTTSLRTDGTMSIEPLFDIVLVTCDKDGTVDVKELRDVCSSCLSDLFTKHKSEFIFEAAGDVTAPDSRGSLSLTKVSARGEDGAESVGAKQAVGLFAKQGGEGVDDQKRYLSCGRPKGGLVDYGVEFPARENGRWKAVRLHRGPWTGCGWPDQYVDVV